MITQHGNIWNMGFEMIFRNTFIFLYFCKGDVMFFSSLVYITFFFSLQLYLVMLLTCIFTFLKLTLFKSIYFQVCPLCAKRVGADLVSHITTQHRSFLKISLSQVGSNSSLLLVLLCLSPILFFICLHFSWTIVYQWHLKLML